MNSWVGKFDENFHCEIVAGEKCFLVDDDDVASADDDQERGVSPWLLAGPKLPSTWMCTVFKFPYFPVDIIFPIRPIQGCGTSAST